MTWPSAELQALIEADAAAAAAVARDAHADEQVVNGQAQARADGLVARLRYRFSADREHRTQAAAQSEAAKQELAALGERLRAELLEYGRQQLAGSAVVAEQQRLEAAMQEAITQRAPSQRLRALVEAVRETAQATESAIANAQSAETFDAVSTGTFATLYSSGQASAARAAARDLYDQVVQLRTELARASTPAQQLGDPQISVPEGMLDLVLDLTGLTGGFDWSSWLALNQLSAARDHVQQMQEALETLAATLAQQAAPFDQAVTQAQQRLEAFAATTAHYLDVQLRDALAGVNRAPTPPRGR